MLGLNIHRSSTWLIPLLLMSFIGGEEMSDSQTFDVTVPVQNNAWQGTLTGKLTITPRATTTPPTTPTTPDPTPSAGRTIVEPYIFRGGANVPNVVNVINQTGIKQFTLAFILSDTAGNPLWDGTRPLHGSGDEAMISSIRNTGGDVTVSFGGWSGRKLEQIQTTPAGLADAYQKVIDAYKLTSIDLDVENTAFSTAAVRTRILHALQIVRQKNPNVRIVITIPTGVNGPTDIGKSFIKEGALYGPGMVNNWTIMPFNFGTSKTDMSNATQTALDGLVNTIRSAYAVNIETAYAMSGISTMNGTTDEGETVTLGDVQDMVAVAKRFGLGRLSNWSVNRDTHLSYTKAMKI
jgi:chitinase